MSVDEISSLIGALGFPIVCSIALFWYINKTIKELADKIEQSISTLSASINENTEATIKLVTTVQLTSKESMIYENTVNHSHLSSGQIVQ